MLKKVQKAKIGLVPVGDVPRNLFHHLIPALQKIYDREVESLTPINIPAAAYNPRRKQYHSTVILHELAKYKPPRFESILGIVDVDLYVPSLNFVFGEADPWNKVGVISVTRLRQQYYGLPANEELFLERTLKEAVHELGHVYGLGHCPDPKCVMHFSNSLADTDRKGYLFCARCRRKLK